MYSQDLNDLAAQTGITPDAMGNTQNAVAKALTTGSGFVGINLESPATLLMPFVSILRNRIPVDAPRMGAKEATWRTQFGFGAYDFAASMGTAEAAVGGEAGASATTFAAPYCTQAVHDSVSIQAIKAGEGYDDPLQIGVMTSLATLLRQEEINTRGGNYAALAAPTGLSVPPGGSGSLTPKASYVVTALTMQGYLANIAGATTPSGTTSGYCIGESVPSASGTCSTAGSKAWVKLAWTPVQGAVAYKIYGGVAGTEYLCLTTSLNYPATGVGDAYVPQYSTQSFITTTACQVTADPGTTTHVPTTDGTATSAGVPVQEGIISWMQKNTIYGQALPSGCNQQLVNCAGAALTVGSDGITEFDNVLAPLWQTWKTSPTFIIGSPRSISNVSGKLMSVGTNNYRIDISAERGRFIGGMFAGGYLNKYVANAITAMPDVIPLLAHPEMPDGTFLFLSEKIPYQYARNARGWALDVQLPYTYFDLARTTVAFPFSVLYTETLKCYHPAAQGCIVGARV